jgi:S1-C subfamily serine protease
MENLSKQQIILLAILVSFVTSIATGIMTVSLLQEAPSTVTQTINRVVERTVERVVQPVIETTKTTPGKTIVERETVVVKEDELVPKSVEQNTATVVRIYRKGTEAGATEEFVSLGVIVSKEGLVLAPSFEFSSSINYSAVLSDGNVFPFSLATSTPVGFSHMLGRLMLPEGINRMFSPIVTMTASKVKLGQTVIGIGGRDRNIVATGIVTGLGRSIKEDGSAGTLQSIETDVDQQSIISGSPLITLSGDVVGIYTLSREASKTFIPIDNLKAIYNF